MKNSVLDFPDYFENTAFGMRQADIHTGHAFRRMVLGKIPFQAFEWRYLRKSGELIWVRVTATLAQDESGRPLHLIASVVDITEEKQSQLRLRESEERFRIVAKVTNDAIWEWDIQNDVNRWNEGIAERFGYPLEETIGEKHWWTNRLHPEDRDRVLAQTHALLAGRGASLKVEYRFRKADGTYAFVQDRGCIIRDEVGRAVRMMGAMNDITEQRECEEERRVLIEQLARSNEALEGFACVTSHDLKEPLRVMSSYVQLIQAGLDGKLDRDMQDFMGFVVDAARRLTALVDNLLHHAKARQAAEERQVDCKAVLEEVLSNLDVAIRESNARIVVGPLPVVEGDPVQLSQVFQNLIANGIKYRSRESPRIEVDCLAKPREYLFTIRDNGIGIDGERAKSIFEMYRRLDSRTDGAGLGLSICKRIVESHGGRIWVESVFGEGSVFYISLPRV